MWALPHEAVNRDECCSYLNPKVYACLDVSADPLGGGLDFHEVREV